MPTKTSPIWDEVHLKALLQLSHYPFHLIQAPPWNRWIEQRGGLKAVYTYLLDLEELTENQRQLLRVILDQPQQSAEWYAAHNHISRKTYFRALRPLLAVLERGLNRWSPPLTLPRAPASNLPAPLTRLIGQEQELNAISVLMQQPGVRLVTLTGPGGIGKTRLAIQAATNLQPLFRSGVFFIALAMLQDPRLVAPTLARALSLNDDGSQPLIEGIKQQLRTKNALLVLDNFEQLREAASLVNELLAEAPEVKALVTSRVHLDVYGEYEFVIPPLAVPEAEASVETAQRSPAVELFVERAQAANQNFVLNEANKVEVIQICSRLDGLPLAIELAAAHGRALTPKEILAHLNRRLDFLATGPRDWPMRQRTIRAAIDWSYSILPPQEQIFFRRLGVFVGGLTAEAATAVCLENEEAATLLEALADQSLLVVEQAAGRRFRFLQTIRDYALEQLTASGELETMQHRQALYYQTLMESLEPESSSAQQGLWLDRLEAERDNLRAVLTWALEHEAIELALRIVGAVWKFWQIRGYLGEGYTWLERILAQAQARRSSLDPQEGLRAYAKALWAAGWTAAVYSAFDQAQNYFSEGDRLAREIGDARALGLALHGLGAIARLRGQYDQADAFYGESMPLFESVGDQEHVAWTWHNFGITEWYRGNYAAALPPLEKGAEIFRTLGQRFALAESGRVLGNTARDLGDYPRAMQFYIESLSISTELGDERNVSLTRANLGSIALSQGDYEQAVTLFKECLVAARQRADKWLILWSLERLAEAAGTQGTLGRAARLWMATETLRERVGMHPTPAEESQRQHGLVAIRLKLDPAEFEAACQAGRAMDLEQVLAYALES